jgi:phosphatidylglycerol:prolipoprotein diacylglycerol transferase
MDEWYFNPIMFEIGPFTAHWYGFMYAISFIVGYLYLNYSEVGKRLKLKSGEKDTLAIVTILGILLGGRLGYALFYNLAFYLQNPLKVFAVWEGGMSLHGGVVGVFLALIWFSWRKKTSFMKIGDVIANIAPLGVMFVRIGNFINAELYGRIADSFCIHFPTDPENCRYPSQLFQAFLEGLILFIILYFVSKKTDKPGVISALFLILYGLFRIIAEFFREPDAHIGFLWDTITEGQLLSILMIIGGILLFGLTRKKDKKAV